MKLHDLYSNDANGVGRSPFSVAALLILAFAFGFPLLANIGVARGDIIELDFELDVDLNFGGRSLGKIGSFSGKAWFDREGATVIEDAVTGQRYLLADALNGQLKMDFVLTTSSGTQTWEQNFTEQDDSEYGASGFGRNAPELLLALDADDNPLLDAVTLLFDSSGVEVAPEDFQFLDPRIEFLDTWTSIADPFTLEDTSGVYRGTVLAITSVPEPSSTWLLLTAGALWPMSRRRTNA